MTSLEDPYLARWKKACACIPASVTNAAVGCGSELAVRAAQEVARSPMWLEVVKVLIGTLTDERVHDVLSALEPETRAGLVKFLLAKRTGDNDVSAPESLKPSVFVVATEFGDHGSRESMTLMLSKNGHVAIEGTGSKVVFESKGPFSDFRAAATRLAKTNKIHLRLVAEIKDPGVGLFGLEEMFPNVFRPDLEELGRMRSPKKRKRPTV